MTTEHIRAVAATLVLVDVDYEVVGGNDMNVNLTIGENIVEQADGGD